MQLLGGLREELDAANGRQSELQAQVRASATGRNGATSLNRDSHIARTLEEAPAGTAQQAAATTTSRAARPTSRNARAAASGLFFHTDRSLYGGASSSSPFFPINNRVGNAFSRNRSSHASRSDYSNPFLVSRSRNA